MKLYVGNLPSQINDVKLREMMLPFGKPESANIARYLIGGASKGFGFVDYANPDEARAAIAGLNGKEILGHTLTVFETSSANTRPWSTTPRARG